MQSWNDLVQVNGSFYCNLSSTAELDDDDQPDSGSAVDWLANGQGIDEPIYLNTLGRTIVRVGDDVTTTEVIDAGHTLGDTTTVTVSQQQQQQHTIKLVIGGEPLSLDTSEYVSWDGGSQVGNDQSSPSTDGCSVLDEDCDSISSPVADSSSSSSASKPPQFLSPQPIYSDRVYNDELTHSCCRFFAERQLRHLSIANTTTTTTTATTTALAAQQTGKTHSSGLEDKMQTLRREIVSLVNQDDALFRQLLALNTSIRQLRSQSLQRRVRTLPGSGSGSSNSNGRTRNQLCPSPSTASLTSLTSFESEEEDEEDGESGDEEGEEEEEEEGHSSIVAALLAQSEKKSMPIAGPVLPTANHPAITAMQQQLQQQQQQQQQQQLTRKRISYPPNGRTRSNSQVSRCSFNSSSSTSSSSSSVSTTGGSSLPANTWSAATGALEAPSVTMVKAASRTPRSPHSSFYTRVSVKTHQQQQQQKQQAKLLALDNQLQLQQQQQKHQQQKHQQQQSNNNLQPMGVHKRQGSYDSGCQGSEEPSDAEVFV